MTIHPMKTTTGILALAAVVALGACSNDENQPHTAAKYITVSASVGPMTLTRTVTDGVTTAFEPGDRISVYAWTGSADAVPSALVVDNSVNTYDGSAWIADPQMLWADMGSAHYFLGIYPVRDVTDFTVDGYTIDVTDQEASDLLVATNLKGLSANTATDGTVDLEFEHVMAKLIVNLNFRDQWGGTPEVSVVKAVSAAASATVNYLTTTATAATDRQDIALPGSTPADGYALGYASVMIPQTGFNTISVTIAGQDYTYTHSTDIPLVCGEYTTVNLIVGRNRIELGSMTVKDWEEGETIDDGEAVD